MKQAALLPIVVLALACAKAPPKADGAVDAGAPAVPGARTEIEWTAPAKWPSVPDPNRFRTATHKVPRVDGDAEDGELVISSATGTLEMNLKRWSGDFGGAQPTTTHRQVNGIDVTVVELNGPYKNVAKSIVDPKPAQPGFKLLAAVIDVGDRRYFFRMIGPEKTVTAARSDFDAFVSTFHRK